MDEWGVVERLLPQGWEAAARECGAFRRARYIKDPSTLLRVLLFHAGQGSGLRQSVAMLRVAGVAELSQVALLKRLRGSRRWLTWIAGELCRQWRDRDGPPGQMRVRVVDSTCVQGPASRGTDWRIHYALDLASLECDWQELTDASGGETLARVPAQPGDVVMADRNYFTLRGIGKVAAAGAYALTRLRWTHPRLLDAQGNACHALELVNGLRTGRVGEWPVQAPVPGGVVVPGRLVALRLPKPLAEEARQRAKRAAAKNSKMVHPNTLKAAEYVLLFTTVPAAQLSAKAVLELYRYRWQVELAFKWLKQLLRIGRVPHKDPEAAAGWIQAKLVLALLLESLFRSARTFSPWGYPLTEQDG